jgi:hypothetical protein
MRAALKAYGVSSLPFRVEELANPGYGEDEGVLYPRFERDGFRRVGPMGNRKTVESRSYTVIVEDDPGWIAQPTPAHPVLRVRYRGYEGGRGRVFEFDLPELPNFLDPMVSWAAYDALGQLVFARLGVLYRYTLEGIQGGEPSAVIDLEPLTPPTGRIS